MENLEMKTFQVFIKSSLFLLNQISNLDYPINKTQLLTYVLSNLFYWMESSQ